MSENYVIYTQEDCKFSKELIETLKAAKETYKEIDVYKAGLHQQFGAININRTPIVYYQGKLVHNGYATIMAIYAGTPIKINN